MERVRGHILLRTQSLSERGFLVPKRRMIHHRSTDSCAVIRGKRTWSGMFRFQYGIYFRDARIRRDRVVPEHIFCQRLLPWFYRVGEILTSPCFTENSWKSTSVGLADELNHVFLQKNRTTSSQAFISFFCFLFFPTPINLAHRKISPQNTLSRHQTCNSAKSTLELLYFIDVWTNYI